MELSSGRVTAGVAVAITAIAVPSAAAQLPGVSTPKAEVPGVQLPQAPALPPAPQVQVPQVQAPDVQVPRAPSAPSVPTPSAPSVSGAPSVRAPAGPGAPASRAGSASSSSGIAALPPAGGSALAPTAPRRPAGRAATAQERRKRAARAREARLGKQARRLRGCLDALPGFDRRVIVLRSGIGTHARSRRAVARRLGVSVERVRRTERSALRGLRAADSDFGCAGDRSSSGPGGGNGGVGLAVASAGARAEPAAGTQLASNSVTHAVAAAPTRNEVAGVSASSGDEPRSGSDSVRKVGPAAASPSDLPLILILLALGLLTVLTAVAPLRRGTPATDAAPPGARQTTTPAPQAPETPPRTPASAAPPVAEGDRRSTARRVVGVVGTVAIGLRKLGRDVRKRIRARKDG